MTSPTDLLSPDHGTANDLAFVASGARWGRGEGECHLKHVALCQIWLCVSLACCMEDKGGCRQERKGHFVSASAERPSCTTTPTHTTYTHEEAATQSLLA